jgi:hypothetical protein
MGFLFTLRVVTPLFVQKTSASFQVLLTSFPFPPAFPCLIFRPTIHVTSGFCTNIVRFLTPHLFCAMHEY